MAIDRPGPPFRRWQALHEPYVSGLVLSEIHGRGE
jgi:hypothetical protein